MRRRSSRLQNTLIFAATGWLFADLFIALAMGFLVADTVGQPMRIVPPTPTPTFTPAPTAQPKPALSLNYIKVYVQGFDPQGVIGGNKVALTQAETLTMNAINSNPQLKGKKAGIVLTFGGAPTANDTGTALEIANKFNSIVMPALGAKGLLFLVTSQSPTKYRQFFNLGFSQNEVELDIYIFSQYP